MQKTNQLARVDKSQSRKSWSPLERSLIKDSQPQSQLPGRILRNAKEGNKFQEIEGKHHECSMESREIGSKIDQKQFKTNRRIGGLKEHHSRNGGQ